jgi:hypothetical protein
MGGGGGGGGKIFAQGKKKEKNSLMGKVEKNSCSAQYKRRAFYTDRSLFEKRIKLYF